MNATHTAITLSAIALAATAGLLIAGPLTPPGGPVGATMKTLAEVEPRIALNAANTPGDANSVFKITQPGSYYLTGNVTGVIGKHGIEIASGGVNLDLNGFDLVGVPGMGAFDGVSVTASGSAYNITVRNGSVRNWGDEGVDLSHVSAFGSAVIDIRANANAGIGISVGNGCSVIGCTASSNTSHGIYANLGSTISACTSAYNIGEGINAASGCTITGCTTFDNAGNGIEALSGCTLSSCTSYANAGNGIAVSSAGTVTGCTVYNNDLNGIGTGNYCTVTGCTVNGSTLDGIIVQSACSVLNNTCSSNGLPGDGAGIHAVGNDNRIEGNNCIGADRGIDVDSPGNVIIKNTCSGNALNWSIVANNVFGPIIDRTAPASPAVNGNSAADSSGSTHPNANFTY